MKEIVQTYCPLCGVQSQYYEIDYGERHYYKCPNCTKFIVTRQADEHLRLQGPRAELSARTVATTINNADQVLEIRYALQDGERALVAEVVNKADYPGI